MPDFRPNIPFTYSQYIHARLLEYIYQNFYGSVKSVEDHFNRDIALSNETLKSSKDGFKWTKKNYTFKLDIYFAASFKNN